MPRLSTYEFADEATLETGLPRHDGSNDASAVYAWIKKVEGKMLPGYIEERFVALSSGLAKIKTDNVAIREDRCHGELASPTSYKCAPFDNCTSEDLPMTKTVIKKDLTMMKTLSFDPVCDDDTITEINDAGGVVTYADKKLQQIARTFAKARNKAVFDFVGTQTGLTAGNATYDVTGWDADTSVDKFNKLLSKLADDFDLEVEDLIVFSNHTVATAPRVAGANYDASGQNGAFMNNYGFNSPAYQYTFQGVEWFASPSFPTGKLFVGKRGMFTYWNAPTYFDERETGCNHGKQFIWTEKYKIYTPCDSLEYAIVNIA